MFARCICVVHTHQLEFVNFSLPCEGRLISDETKMPEGLAIFKFCNMTTSHENRKQDVGYRGSAAWLAQLVERQSAVREVGGSSPGPDQHSGS